MTLNEKQKKGLWIAGAGLILIHFAPNLVHMFARPPQPTKPSAAIPFTPAPAVLPAAPLIDPQFAMLAGNWSGTYLKPKFICDTKMELHANAAAPEPFTGYTTLTCRPTDVQAAITPGKPVNWVETMIKASTPTSAIFTGKIAGPSIQLHLTQQIGKPQDGCQPTGYTLTPFGDNQLAAKWNDTPCEEGQVVMKRAMR